MATIYVNAVIVTAITIILGYFVFVNVFDAIPTTNMSANDTAFLNQLKTTTNAGFQLLVIGIIVIAAVGILSYVTFLRG
ncbi:MAG: hypothetical protein QXU32_03360 [Nitrososphaerales archaeon]